MKIFVLHDPRQEDKYWAACEDELARQGIENYQVWGAVYGGGSTVEANINAAHKRMVRAAQSQGLEAVCILESDVMFPHPEGWKYFLGNKPDHFDMYLGGVYSLNQGAQDRLEPGACDIHNFAGMHCYIVHERFYDKFLSVPDDRHIDLVLAGFGVYKVCYPFAAIQRPGWSANRKMKVNYNDNIITNRQVYGWEYYHDEKFP